MTLFIVLVMKSLVLPVLLYPMRRGRYYIMMRQNDTFDDRCLRKIKRYHWNGYVLNPWDWIDLHSQWTPNSCYTSMWHAIQMTTLLIGFVLSEFPTYLFITSYFSFFFFFFTSSKNILIGGWDDMHLLSTLLNFLQQWNNQSINQSVETISSTGNLKPMWHHFSEISYKVR